MRVNFSLMAMFLALWCQLSAGAKNAERGSALDFAKMEMLQSGDFGKDRDRQICDKVSYSTDADKFFKAYTTGKIQEGDRYWRVLLDQVKACASITELLKRLNARMYFMDDASNISGKTFYVDLLNCTEKALGKEHRFVADICIFYSDYFDGEKNYAEEAKLRVRILDIRTKAFGRNAAITAHSIVDVGRVYAKMKDYGQAEKYLKEALSIGDRYNYESVVARSLSEYVPVLTESGRAREAAELSAKYRKTGSGARRK